MKLATMRRIAHHTSGESKPLTPVQDHALSGSATSVAPRFKRSSETNTHSTLKASCSHGLPKPEGRSCIRLFSPPSSRRNRFRGQLQPPRSVEALQPPSKLISVRESP